MKLRYTTPSVTIVTMAPSHIICTSIAGVNGTGTFRTEIDESNETDTYLARRSSNVWDDEEEE